MSDVLTFHVENKIGYLKLSNPPQNRMDIHFIQSFTQIIPIIEKSEIDGLIIYGEGRHFSSGADTEELIELSNGTDRSGNFFEINIENFRWIESRPYPTIAAISGCALGFGLELALTCNYRICTKNAIFSLPESGFGLMPGCGGTVRLPKLIGKANSTMLILEGRMVSSNEAAFIGLVDKIVDKQELINYAETILINNNKRRK